MRADLFRSAPAGERKAEPESNKEQTGHFVEDISSSAAPAKPRGRLARAEGDSQIDQRSGDIEEEPECDDLQSRATTRWIYELRQECQEEKRHFRIQDIGDHPLAENNC